eukprot:Sspe_Gene.83515::Locus_54784_Transcript_1_1_Confidence_1.000_Length_1659::g.83515::m.83515
MESAPQHLTAEVCGESMCGQFIIRVREGDSTLALHVEERSPPSESPRVWGKVLDLPAVQHITAEAGKPLTLQQFALSVRSSVLREVNSMPLTVVDPPDFAHRVGATVPDPDPTCKYFTLQRHGVDGSHPSHFFVVQLVAPAAQRVSPSDPAYVAKLVDDNAAMKALLRQFDRSGYQKLRQQYAELKAKYSELAESHTLLKDEFAKLQTLNKKLMKRTTKDLEVLEESEAVERKYRNTISELKQELATVNEKLMHEEKVVAKLQRQLSSRNGGMLSNRVVRDSPTRTNSAGSGGGARVRRSPSGNSWEGRPRVPPRYADRSPDGRRGRSSSCGSAGRRDSPRNPPPPRARRSPTPPSAPYGPRARGSPVGRASRSPSRRSPSPAPSSDSTDRQHFVSAYTRSNSGSRRRWDHTGSRHRYHNGYDTYSSCSDFRKTPPRGRPSYRHYNRYDDDEGYAPRPSRKVWR